MNQSRYTALNYTHRTQRQAPSGEHAASTSCQHAFSASRSRHTQARLEPTQQQAPARNYTIHERTSAASIARASERTQSQAHGQEQAICCLDPVPGETRMLAKSSKHAPPPPPFLVRCTPIGRSARPQSPKSPLVHLWGRGGTQTSASGAWLEPSVRRRPRDDEITQRGRNLVLASRCRPARAELEVYDLARLQSQRGRSAMRRAARRCARREDSRAGERGEEGSIIERSGERSTLGWNDGSIN